MERLSEEIYVIISISIFVLILVLFFFLIIYLYQKRNERYEEQRKLLHSEFNRTLLQSQLEIQEKTLKTISQEIHDNIGQVLSLAKLNLFTINPDDRENFDQKLKASKELVSKAIVDLRDLSHTMNTDYIEDLGLMRSIEYELEMIQKSGALKTSMEINGSVYKFDKQKELIAFRIIQEVINNTIKHAQASNLKVYASFNQNCLELIIADDGVGIEIDTGENGFSKLGLGIKNMYSRAKMIDGNFIIKSEPGNGTSITLTIFKENPPNNETNREN